MSLLMGFQEASVFKTRSEVSRWANFDRKCLSLLALRGYSPAPFGRCDLTNRHWKAEGRDAVLVEAFDRHPIGLTDRKRSKLQRGFLVGEALVGLI